VGSYRKYREDQRNPFRPSGLPRLFTGGAGATTVPVSDTSNFIIRDNPEHHRFETDLGGGEIAYAAYTLPKGKILFTHTEVPEAYEGRGIGTKLIEFALGEARKRGLQVMPACQFFAAYMRKHAEVQDLLDPAYRSVLGLD